MDAIYKVKAVNEIVTSKETGATHIGVTIHWFCAERKRPVVSYEEAIPEWAEILESDSVDDRQLSYYNTASNYIDQYFTRDEAQALCDYLTIHHASEIVLEAIELPLNEADVPFTSIPAEPEAGEGYGFLDIPESDEYTLPFSIRGYFDSKYKTTLERYQYAITRSLVDFKTPAVGVDADNFQEMVTGLKKRLIELQDSLVVLRNVFEMINGGKSKHTEYDTINDQQSQIDGDKS